MRWMDTQGVRYLQFPHIAAVPGVWHGIFTRYAFNKDGSALTMDVGLQNGLPARQVWENRRRMLAVAGGTIAVFARQVHGADVGVWEGSAAGEDCPQAEMVALSGDALVTRMTGVALVIQTADCQSVLIVDPEKRVLANVHAGWRGSIQNVAGRAVHVMSERFGSRPADLICGVGPSLGPCCAEFVRYRREIPQDFWSYRLPGDHFDFWRITVDQLVAKGVSRPKIAVSGLCTRCNTRLFHSYRGEGKRAGRFAAVIRLTDPPG